MLSSVDGSILAISSDELKDAKKVYENNDLPFDVLCDVRLEAIKAYGLFHHEPFHDMDVSLPANILIDRDGKIAWMHIAQLVQDRLDPKEVMKQVERLVK